ncbi:hypothetical protein [Gibbsiella quercinecans]|uniref:hypothetical protein n=1 Tax=Gibbsiella quercinecans TaxID=929813 RepID=UPI002431634C|nr:hypothetical protein [Gibbsiella quercinecans]
MKSNEYRYIRLLNNGGYDSFGEKFPVIVLARVTKFACSDTQFSDIPISENIRVNPKSVWKGDADSFGPLRAQLHLHVSGGVFEVLTDEEVSHYELTGKTEPDVNPFAYWNKIKGALCLF